MNDPSYTGGAAVPIKIPPPSDAPQQESVSNGYFAHIDGLRAVAVIAVILFHLKLGCPGGYVGVDIFFVISGFLITGLIVRDLENKTFSVANFWERRIRRIMPAAFVVVAATLLAGWKLLILPSEFEDVGKSALAQALLLSNLYFWSLSGYFEQPFAVRPLLHTWSLSVEEQFYLLFPFLMVGVYKFSRRALLPLILILLGVSLLLCVEQSYSHSRSNFYFLPSRAWELLIGALLVLIPKDRFPNRRICEWLGVIGLGAMLFAVFFYTKATRFPGILAVPPCLGAALLIGSSLNQSTFVGRILAMRPVVFIGTISYSLYLWHWPIYTYIAYWDTRGATFTRGLITLAATLVAAVVSWKFVETPIRKRTLFKSRGSIFAFAAAATSIVGACSLYIIHAHGIPERFPPNIVRLIDIGSNRFTLNATVESVSSDNAEELGEGDKSKPLQLLVCGDSHAWQLLPLLDVLCKENHVRGVAIAHMGTDSLLGGKSDSRFCIQDSEPYQRAIIDFARRHHAPNVFFAGNWSAYAKVVIAKPDNLTESYRATVEAYKGSGAKLWFIQDPPSCPYDDPPRRLAFAALFGQDPEAITGLAADKYYRETNQLFEKIRGSLPSDSMAVIDPAASLVDPHGRFRIIKDGQALYSDGEHLAIAGTMALRPAFEPIIKGISMEAKKP